MHPYILEMMMRDRMRELERVAVRPQVAPAVGPVPTDEAVDLRLCRVHDDEALRRLAELDGRTLPAGSFVIAEVDGVIVAALPLGGGAPLADPFRATSQIIPLLRLRAEQITEAGRAPRRRTRLLGVLSRS
jgi:hypothetical protein